MTKLHVEKYKYIKCTSVILDHLTCLTASCSLLRLIYVQTGHFSRLFPEERTSYNRELNRHPVITWIFLGLFICCLQLQIKAFNIHDSICHSLFALNVFPGQTGVDNFRPLLNIGQSVVPIILKMTEQKEVLAVLRECWNGSVWPVNAIHLWLLASYGNDSYLNRCI